MARLLTTLLTTALLAYSYFEIRVSQPLLTARVRTNSGSTVPVAPLMRIDFSISFVLQVLFAGLLLCLPYFAAENIHFGSWRLSRYKPEQRRRILPLLRDGFACSAGQFLSYRAHLLAD